MIEEGSKAPEFSLMGSDGKKHTLSEFKGSYVILYFYPKDDTSGCTIEAKEFNQLMGEMDKKGAKVIGVSKDTVESHKQFKDKYGLNLLLLSDPESATIKAYDSYGNKGVFGFGTIRNTFIIDKDGKIEKIFKRVTPTGHGSEVMSCLS